MDNKWNDYLDDKGEITVQLMKALYGCVESAVLWYNTITEFLGKLGFKASPYDKCILWKVYEDETHFLIVLYVDDLLMTCAILKYIDELIEELRKEFKDLTVNNDKVFTYLGMLFNYSSPGELIISMPHYTREVLELCDIVDPNDIKPSPDSDKLFSEDNTPLLCANEKANYHSIVAKLLYMAKRTRPDILLYVSYASTRVLNPTEKDRKDLQRLLKYLNGSIELGLVFKASEINNNNDNNKINLPDIKSFADASFNCHIDSKSHSGVCVMLGSACVFASSTKQKIVTRSTPESELVAADGGAAAAINIGNLIKSIDYEINIPILYQDNTSAIAIIEEGGPKSFRTRHIALKFFFISDRTKSGELKIEYVSTDFMLADLLTKPLQGTKFSTMRNMLMNCDRIQIASGIGWPK